jgi:phosphoribosylglycinamide formyltransferase-1
MVASTMPPAKSNLSGMSQRDVMGGSESRFVFVVSTSGSVMNQVLESPFLRKVVHSVVADRPCPAVEKAKVHQVPVQVFQEVDNEAFCDRLREHLEQHDIDYVISFYTQFYARPFRDAYQDRIINFHPSLLPAFKGMDGFGDGMAYHAKIIGTTVEFIKDVMDEGKIIMQSACAVNPNIDMAAMRHRIFVQQCKSLIQVVKWLVQDRVKIIGDQIVIGGASYQDVEFSPALEFHEAMNLRVPSISA